MNSGRYVALQFLLDKGIILQPILAEEEARQILQGWDEGKLKTVIGGGNQFGAWRLKVETVVAIHCVPVPQQQLAALQGQQQAGQVVGNVWRPGASGL